MLARGFAQVVVDVARRQATGLAVLVLVLEQVLARQLLAAPHDARHARIVDLGAVHDAALALEVQPERRALDVGMAVAQRGEAIGAVAGRVFLVAHAQEGGVEQAHQGGQHALPVERGVAAGGQVARDTGADARQGLAEGLEPLELAFVLQGPPLRVVAILLATARIDAGGLQVTLRERADPDIGVGRRDRQAVDARDLPGIAQPAAGRVLVAEAFAMPETTQAGHVGIDVDQAAGEGVGSRVGGGGGAGG